jgi:RNA polymerase sigma-70 factor (ECF subfamily)
VNQFNHLYQLHYPMVQHLIARMVGDSDEVNDLTQEVFVKLYVQLNAGNTVVFPKTWLYRVATHLTINHLSRSKKHLQLEEAHQCELPETDTAEGQLEAGDRKRLVEKALMKLEERDRILLVLYAEGLSYKEIAEISSIGLTSVGKLLSRALQKLKKELNDEGYELFE